MEEAKKASEKKSKLPEDLGRTVVLEMPDDFEDPLYKSIENSVEEEPSFEIDLDEPDSKLDETPEKLHSTPITKKLGTMSVEERIALAKAAIEGSADTNLSHGESTIRLEDSQGVQDIEFDFDNAPTEVVPAKQLIESIVDNDGIEISAIRNRPGEIYREYSKLTPESIEELKMKLRSELIKIAESAKSPKEVIEKQNAFILDHANKLGFPKNLALRLIANGRRILPIAPLATQGGMSVVFESLNLNNDSEVLFGSVTDDSIPPTTDILKVVYGTKNIDSVLERFKQEAIAGANLNLKEKGVVGVRDADFEVPEAGYFMVLEKAEGNDLQEEIRSEKLTPEKVISYGLDIAKALKSVHEAGIIHRDIKPANIYIHREQLSQAGKETVKETVKLADLGLIKIGAESKNTEGEVVLDNLGISKAGQLPGTPLYKAPEGFIGKESSFKSDIYALGITFYQLLTKKFPYLEMTNFKELVSSATEGKTISLSELTKQPEYKDIPFGLAELIDEMIEVDPSNRPEIDEVIERLQQLQNSEQEQPTIPQREAAVGGRLSTISNEDAQKSGQSVIGKIKSLFSRK